MKNTMGERMRMRRKELGYTQTQMGDYIGVSKSTIAKYEHGRVARLPKAEIERLAEFLSCDVIWLMGLNEEPIDKAEFKKRLSALIRHSEDITRNLNDAELDDIYRYIIFRAGAVNV